MTQTVSSETQPSLQDELKTLTDKLIDLDHDPLLLKLACIAHLMRHAVERVRTDHGVDQSKLIDLCDQCLRTYVRTKGVPDEKLCAVVKALEQAIGTYRYLATLPT